MSWRDQAACTPYGPDMFDIGPPTDHPNRAKRRAEKAGHALTICQTCPVLEPCRQDALKAGYWGMVAGGLLPEHQGPHDWIITLTGRPNEKPINHGTRAGYLTHLRRSQKPCRPCTIAATEYNQQRRKNTG